MKYIKEILIGILFISCLYFYSTSTIRNSDDNLRKEFQTLREDIDKKNNNTINYLESRVNNLAQRQDEYQVGSNARMDIIENRLGLSINDNKNINTNINNIVINGNKNPQ